MLRPLIFTEEELNKINIESNNQSGYRTYKIDFNINEVSGEVSDYNEAVRQYVIKTIKTARDRYLIYSSNIGSELHYLLGKSYSLDYLKLEVPRLIDEAIMVDSRISGTKNYSIKKEGNELHISFEVITDLDDNVRVEVVI